MFRRGAEADPFVSESRLNASRNHRLENRSAAFIADPVQQLAAGAHVLHRLQAAALMVHARQAVARELFRDVRDAVARALFPLRRRQRPPRADPIECGRGEVGDSPVELPTFTPCRRCHPFGLGVALVTPAISNALLL